ncbi:abortive infection family protein [Actinomadura sp. NPDC048955]|uniref:abortive infection family protein n=1 Tax=Actinomadura sp. NPDC048955 TaxID=3158228 RepID=UPI0033FA0D8D
MSTDGFDIDQSGRIRPPETLFLDGSLGAVTDPAVIVVLLNRIRQIPPDDPMLAIGTAKELVESTAKIVLNQLRVQYSPTADMPHLVSEAQKALGEHPVCVAAGVDGVKEARRLLGSLSTAGAALAALRNSHGTGHGPAALPHGLRPRHGRLALSAADAWCTYVLDTLTDLTSPAPTPAVPVPPPAHPIDAQAVPGGTRPRVIAPGGASVPVGRAPG